MASEKIGKSIYALPEKEQALWLLHELEQFANRHYWLKFITFESLHRDAITMGLKTWLGEKLQTLVITEGFRDLLFRTTPLSPMMPRNESAVLI